MYTPGTSHYYSCVCLSGRYYERVRYRLFHPLYTLLSLPRISPLSVLARGSCVLGRGLHWRAVHCCCCTVHLCPLYGTPVHAARYICARCTVYLCLLYGTPVPAVRSVFHDEVHRLVLPSALLSDIGVKVLICCKLSNKISANETPM